ncbi:leucine-rich repeat domain-containing protein [Adhaeretor mobilis]|uniref:Internalin-A n=1 Tax=Adhaeretor mobilis TaxID=1930276 RepID=A0A517MX03_9BACT|nr:hypothetical protein [Adhaeretor mobilis]QDS99403.1 Internalin-A precursor [Adhaeretor mobilis]
MTVSSNNPPADSRPRRRWFRFSLRSLLIATVVVSLFFGLIVRPALEERDATEAIISKWGTVVYDWQVRARGSDSHAKPERPGPEWLRRWLGAHWFEQVVEVRLSGASYSDDKDRFKAGSHLKKLPALRSLSVNSFDLTVEDYRLLGNFTRIDELWLNTNYETRVQDAAELARNTGLRKLHILRAKVSREALLELTKLPNLERLSISCSSYDPQTGDILKEFQLQDDVTEALVRFFRLKSLSLFGTQITNDGMAELSRLTQLEHLTVSSPEITGESFEYVVKLKNLESLGTWAWDLKNADFKKLQALPNLTSLDLQTEISAEQVPGITDLKRLEKLTLRGDEINDESLQHFYKLRGLTWLNLSDTRVKKYGAAAKALKKAFPNCTIRLPKTKEEEERKRAFRNLKYGG